MTQMVKTTIILPEDLLQQAKVKAIHEKKTLSQLVSEGLETRLTAEKQTRKAPADPMKTLGKLKLGITKVYEHRSELYDDHLKRKMGV